MATRASATSWSTWRSKAPLPAARRCESGAGRDGVPLERLHSEEQTVYYAAVLPEYWDRAVELLSDIMRPSLREEDFHTEKQVVLEEIAKYDDQPPFGAHERCMAAHFLDHPLARSVLGTAASVGALTPAQMRTYFEGLQPREHGAGRGGEHRL